MWIDNLLIIEKARISKRGRRTADPRDTFFPRGAIRAAEERDRRACSAAVNLLRGIVPALFYVYARAGALSLSKLSPTRPFTLRTNFSLFFRFLSPPYRAIRQLARFRLSDEVGRSKARNAETRRHRVA